MPARFTWRISGCLAVLMVAACQQVPAGTVPVASPSASVEPPVAPSAQSSVSPGPADYPSLRLETEQVKVFANLHAPKTAKWGNTVPVVVSIGMANSCAREPMATAIVDEATKTVTFEATRTYFKGMVCTDASWTAQAGANFTPKSTGTYRLKATILPSGPSPESTYWHFGIALEPWFYAGKADPVDVELAVEVTN